MVLTLTFPLKSIFCFSCRAFNFVLFSSSSIKATGITFLSLTNADVPLTSLEPPRFILEIPRFILETL